MLAGSVRKLATTRYQSSNDGGKPVWMAGGALEVISVRGSSSSPDLKNLQPLNRDPDRIAFLYAWMQAKEAVQAGAQDASTLKGFLLQARCIRVSIQQGLAVASSGLPSWQNRSD